MSFTAEKTVLFGLNKIPSAVDTGPYRQHRVDPPLSEVVVSPPVRSTLSFASSVDVSHRACVPPVDVCENVVLAGSNKSPRAEPFESVPPATRTRPSLSNVAAAPVRAVLMLPAGLKRPVLGSNNSAVAVPPPARTTLPSLSNVAIIPIPPKDMLPVKVNVPL